MLNNNDKLLANTHLKGLASSYKEVVRITYSAKESELIFICESQP